MKLSHGPQGFPFDAIGSYKKTALLVIFPHPLRAQRAMQTFNYVYGPLPALAFTYLALMALAWRVPGIDTQPFGATIAGLVNPVILGLAIPFVWFLLADLFQPKHSVPVPSLPRHMDHKRLHQYGLVVFEETARLLMLHVLSRPQSHHPSDPDNWKLIPTYVLVFAFAHAAGHTGRFLVYVCLKKHEYPSTETVTEFSSPQAQITLEVPQSYTISLIVEIRRALKPICHSEHTPKESQVKILVGPDWSMTIEEPLLDPAGLLSPRTVVLPAVLTPPLNGSRLVSLKMRGHQGLMVLYCLIEEDSRCLDFPYTRWPYAGDANPVLWLNEASLTRPLVVFPYAWQLSDILSQFSTTLLLSLGYVWSTSTTTRFVQNAWPYALAGIFSWCLAVRLLRPAVIGGMWYSNYKQLSFGVLAVDTVLFIGSYICLLD